jgi:hypothetical protein
MTDQKPIALAFNGSRLFTAWLKEAKVSLAMTTYQAGKVFLLGLQPDGRLSVFERTFERPMGLGVGQGRFWMSSIHPSAQRSRTKSRTGHDRPTGRST